MLTWLTELATFDLLPQSRPDGTYLMDSSITDPADLAECVRALSDVDRRLVRRYWDQVIREEWIPPSRFTPGPAPLAEDWRRERREARRDVLTARDGHPTDDVVPCVEMPSVTCEVAA